LRTTGPGRNPEEIPGPDSGFACVDGFRSVLVDAVLVLLFRLFLVLWVLLEVLLLLALLASLSD
jgi:hypothetical protein